MDAPVKAREQLPRVVRFDPREIRKAVSKVEGFNAKLALVITGSVGTMACAYVFAVIALISLPAAISSGQVIVIVAWVAQTFLQLVLLSIIMVAQSVQSAASGCAAPRRSSHGRHLLCTRRDRSTPAVIEQRSGRRGGRVAELVGVRCEHEKLDLHVGADGVV